MKRSDVILALAPHFTHGFDFSVPAQYQEWADKTAMAAEPFVKLIADEELAHRATQAENKELKAGLAGADSVVSSLRMDNVRLTSTVEQLTAELAKKAEAAK